MNNYNYRANINYKVDLTVVAENKEEADRLLQDTIDSITEDKLRELLSQYEQVQIKNGNITRQFYDIERKKEVER